MGRTTFSNEDWRVARLLAEPLLDQPVAQALQKVPEGASPAVVACLQHILQAASEQKTIFGRLESGRLFRGLLGVIGQSGQCLDGYELEELVALGGLSAIYRGHHQDRPEQPVAIKLLNPDYSGDLAHRLYRQERDALQTLRHPNVIRLLDSNDFPKNGGYLVLEYLHDVQPLDEYARKYRQRPEKLVTLLLAVAETMAYVHARGVIHNDLKATNILIDPKYSVKIIDFGIAQSRPVRQGGRGESLGYTPYIAALEQIKGQTITPQVDVFLLGATLLHVLTGQNPLPAFTPQSYSPANDERYVSQLLEKSDIDTTLKAIVRRALKTDCKQRYADMRALAEALRCWLESHS